MVMFVEDVTQIYITIFKDEKLRAESHIRQTEDRLLRQQEEMRRRQEEAKLLMQAENLNSILDTQEHLDYDAPSSSTRGDLLLYFTLCKLCYWNMLWQ